MSLPLWPRAPAWRQLQGTGLCFCHPFVGLQEDGSVPSQEAEVLSESLVQTSSHCHEAAALHGAGEGLFSCVMEAGWCWSPTGLAVGAGLAAIPGARAAG